MKQFDSEHLEHIIKSSIVSDQFFRLQVYVDLNKKLPKGRIRHHITFVLSLNNQDINDRVILIRESILWEKLKANLLLIRLRLETLSYNLYMR